jgi:mono/diheme cytochrome c family protein
MPRLIFSALAAASLSGLLADTLLAGESKPAGDKAAPAEAAADGDKPAGGGKVSWAVYEGFKRYHAECHTCHGPNGLGSTFAPALAETMKGGSAEQFKEIVAKGKASGEKAMPGFANNPNVMCYVDSIYAYLKARADGTLKAGDDAVKDHEEKTQEAKDAEAQCMK